MNYDKELLRDIYWSFNNEQYDSQKDFEAALTEYYKLISGDNIPIQFDKIVINSPKVVIQYMKYNYDEEDWDEPQVLFEAGNENGFTAGELLYKIHKDIGKELEGEDNVFFEGLTFATIDDPDFPKIPVYFLDTGS